MQANNFYIYEHIRPDTGMIFYVGKGCGKRLNSGKFGGGQRNKHWKAIVSKANGFIANKIVENINEELAFLVEEERIDQLKRLGYKLSNKTNGGCGGIKGYSHTNKTKKKISEHHKEFYKNNPAPCLGKFGKNHPAYGYKHTEKARKSMSDNASMKRPEVVSKISGKNATLAKTVEYNGQIFETIDKLAEYLGINRSTLGVRIFRNPEKYGIKILGKTRDLKPLEKASK